MNKLRMSRNELHHQKGMIVFLSGKFYTYDKEGNTQDLVNN